MLSLKPQYWYDTIYDIDFDKLKGKGVKCILFDIDNTMATYSESFLLFARHSEARILPWQFFQTETLTE